MSRACYKDICEISSLSKDMAGRNFMIMKSDFFALLLDFL